MEEKIIEGKFKKTIVPFIICAIAILFIIICAANEVSNIRDSYWSGDPDATLFDGLVNLVCFETYYGIINPIMFYVWVLVILVSLLVFFMTKGCAITISTTRVVGIASFGKRVDLPLNQISAIGLGMFNSIAIATSSGKINFWLLTNRNEVHEALSQQLAAFQVQASSNDAAKVATTSSADELKKFKELLDAGVITQEEFDSKKKQLLGL